MWPPGSGSGPRSGCVNTSSRGLRWMMSGSKPSRSDTEIAKNYLTDEELDTLNRIVSMYLDFAELQALNRKPMYMRDWIAKLDDSLRVSERDILTHAGRVGHEEAIEKARAEYEKFRKQILEEPSPVERHFIEAVQEVKNLEKGKARCTRKGKKNRKSSQQGRDGRRDG